jgi:hypothetical protein
MPMRNANRKLETINSLRPSATLTIGWRRGIGLFCLALAVTIESPAQDDQASPDAVTFNSLFSFDGTNGADPIMNLVQGFDGNLYGTADAGGNSGTCAPICGVAFRLTPGGAETTTYEFCSHQTVQTAPSPICLALWR